MKKVLLLFSLLLITVFICISQGSVQIPFEVLYNIFFYPHNLVQDQQQYHKIIYMVRIPRVLSVMLVGMALSLSGTIMQGLLQNPLADGSTLGVASGASLGAILFMMAGNYLPLRYGDSNFIGACLGAFLSLLIILSITQLINKNYSSMTVILVGIIFSMFANSIISFLITFAGEKLRTIIFWSMGSFSGATYQDVILLTVLIIIIAGLLQLKAVELNALSLGEDHARNIGVDVTKSRLFFIITASILIGMSVAIAGSIAFVGLIIPHITRIMIGPDHRKLFITTMINGGIFLMWADLIARSILAPKELPIGVITSFIGTLVFLFILIRHKRGII